MCELALPSFFPISGTFPVLLGSFCALTDLCFDLSGLKPSALPKHPWSRAAYKASIKADTEETVGGREGVGEKKKPNANPPFYGLL